ncbi:MAG: glutamate--tRNA ligase [Candidatus Binatia bacterium]|nr:MAG: glutamate--tRNA ligase [Candidatus Binatia bacterium]
MEVRTRFAPSPTGFLHVGGARTALFNYLFARHHGGRFVLRIEDTDRERSTPEAVRAILDSLEWLELRWDEGPFFQSERAELYRKEAERLWRSGAAYWCGCPPEALEEKRKAALAEGRNPLYDRTCRNLGLGPGENRVLRFRSPLEGTTGFVDRIRGAIAFQNSDLDDWIVLRSDGSPTYNFAVVVDDAEMRITHVIRGEDHIANTPKQILVYRALGFPLPEFAHVPLILGLDRARLSKRHGATSVGAYREEGYLPDAVVNYLVRLGWSHGDQEIFTREELIEKFTLEAVGKSAGVFNPEKLLWVNAQHMKRTPPERLAELARPFLEARGYAIPPDPAWLVRLVEAFRERARTLVELADMVHYFFSEDVSPDPEAATRHLGPEGRAVLREVRGELERLAEWSEESLRRCFEALRERLGVGLGKIAQPVRVAVTGGTSSPGIYEVLFLLGRERTLARIDRVLAQSGSGPAGSTE